MLIKCVAIDDDPLALELLKAYIEKVTTLQLVQSFDDAVNGIEFIKKHPVHLLFLDIKMPDVNGLDFLSLLPEKPMIVFTTAHKKLAVEGFELEAVDYLVKPYTFERFKKAVLKSEEFFKYKSSLQSVDEFLYVYSEYRLIKINLVISSLLKAWKITPEFTLPMESLCLH